MNPTEEEIRIRAYDIWVENGRPHGRDEEFWSQAERELGGDEAPEDMPEYF
jgi:hypothetical protein